MVVTYIREQSGFRVTPPHMADLLLSKIESAVGYDVVTPTTNVCDSNTDCLDLVTCMRNYIVIFWLEIAPESFSEDLKFPNFLGEDAPRPFYIAVCCNMYTAQQSYSFTAQAPGLTPILLPTVM